MNRVLLGQMGNSVTDVEIGGGKIQGREIIPGRGRFSLPCTTPVSMRSRRATSQNRLPATAKSGRCIQDGRQGEVPTVSAIEAVSADKGEAQEIPCTVTTVNVNGQDCEALSYTVTDANGQTATVSYCLVGDDLKYVVTDAAEGRTIVEYRVTSTTVDQNLFNIPADYQILTQAEFEAAQANH